MNKKTNFEVFRPDPSEETIRRAFEKMEIDYELALEKGDPVEVAKVQKAANDMLTELRMSNSLITMSPFEQKLKEMAETQTDLNHQRLNNKRKE